MLCVDIELAATFICKTKNIAYKRQNISMIFCICLSSLNKLAIECKFAKTPRQLHYIKQNKRQMPNQEQQMHETKSESFLFSKKEITY